MSDFWSKFEKTMDSFGEMMSGLGDYIEEEVERIDKEAHKKPVRGFFRSVNISKTINIKDGHTVVTTTKDGKTTVTVDGKEYIPKEG